MRIGFGKDIHRLISGEGICLGGIKIPCEYKFVADSDGDVILHAISDAILSASHKGDIGDYFTKENVPSGMNSKVILDKALSMMPKENEIENISVVLFIEKPKVSKYRTQIETNIAKMLNIKPEQVSLSLKTNEGLGDIGSSKAVLAEAVILLK